MNNHIIDFWFHCWITVGDGEHDLAVFYVGKYADELQLASINRRGE